MLEKTFKSKIKFVILNNKSVEKTRFKHDSIKTLFERTPYQRNHFGPLKIQEDDFYEIKIIIDDQTNGSHLDMFKDIKKFDDELIDRKLNGNDGIFFYSNGDKYKGEWKDDKRHGNGVIFYSNGHKYDGQWENDKKHGMGKFTWSNGDTYEGKFDKGQMNEYGIYLHKNGNRYEGEWRADKRHGNGVFTRKDGAKYVGEWKDGRKNGNGTYVWPSGKIYVGNWNADKIDDHEINLKKSNP